MRFSHDVFVLVLLLAMALLAGEPRAHAREYRVAILQDSTASRDQAVIERTTALLRRGGYEVDALSAVEIATATALNAQQFDCLVLTSSPQVPASAKENLHRFIEAGGDLVLMGGRPFTDPLFRVHQAWLTRAQCLRARQQLPPQHMLFDFEQGGADLAGWTRSSNNMQSASSVDSSEGYTGWALRVNVVQMTGWDSYGAKVTDIPATHDLLSFWAKGDQSTPQIVLEVAEADGARFTAVVNITPEWRRIFLRPRDLHYYEGGDPRRVSRAVSLSNVRWISFGLANNFTNQDPGSDHSFWIDEIGTSDAQSLAVPDVSDFEFGLYAFEDLPGYRLRGIHGVRPHRDSPARGVGNDRVSYSGASAVATALAMQSQFVPLLDALDRYGRTQGWAAGMLVNYAGPWRGSQWLIYGIEDKKFYLNDRSFALSLLQSLKQMASGRLPERYAREDMVSRNTTMACVAPAPGGFVHLSSSGTQFLDGEGRPLFLTGLNYTGPFDRVGYMGYGPFPPEHGWYSPKHMLRMAGAWDATLLEEDFRKARAAGVNVFRFWTSGLEMFPHMVEAVKQCARKYGIYLIIVADYQKRSQQEMESWLRVVGNAWRDEPMVIGYDLANEPELKVIGMIDIDNQPAPIRATDWYEVYKDRLGEDWHRRYADTEGYKNLRSPWGTGRAALNYELFMDLYGRLGARYGSFWDYAALRTTLDRDDPEYGELIRALDDTFGAWAAMRISAVRKVDREHLITVGYNQLIQVLPSNKQIDFISQHAYPWLQTYDGLLSNLRFMDRLQLAFPHKPITFGETGYSNGVRTKSGEYMDEQSSCLGDLLHYLYAWTHGYSGLMKWTLNDWPEAVMRDNGYWQGPYDLQGRCGIYGYDGTRTGRPKPFVWAMRFFREYLDSRPADKGQLEITRGETPFGGVFVFRAQDALFVGDAAYRSEELSFSHATPITVMLWKTPRRVQLMATADVTVTLDLSALLPESRPEQVGISGRCISRRMSGSTLEVELMAGETLMLRGPEQVQGESLPL